MSDYSAAQITIGGWISRRLVPRLCHVLRHERLALDWGETTFAPRFAEELLAGRQLVDGGLVLQLCEEQACDGEFAALETFLRKHRIPFDRRTHEHFSDAACLMVYRPATGQQTYWTTHDGAVVIPAAPVWDVDEQVAALLRLSKRGSRAVIHRRLQHTLSILREELPFRPVPLEALEIGRSIGLRKAA